jgi:hypothetical protein
MYNQKSCFLHFNFLYIIKYYVLNITAFFLSFSKCFMVSNEKEVSHCTFTNGEIELLDVSIIFRTGAAISAADVVV